MIALFVLLLAQSRAVDDSAAFVRVNQLGYLPDAPKVAVVCALRPVTLARFTVENERGERVLGSLPARRDSAFAACAETWRLDFSALRRPGRYRVRVGDYASPSIRIGNDVYRGLADTLMGYMRQQRSGYNPFLRDSAHRKDAIIVDHSTRGGETISVSGGWADAADYLQYVTTSATATYHLLAAYRDARGVFVDAYDARGLPGPNGVADVLDEARHGLEWLVRMFPDDSTMFNQLGDDRDHTYWDLITTDSSDYGWGKGGARPVYPCTGKPQGILGNVNRSTGYASTAGKMAAAFALGARLVADRAFADTLAKKAVAAYALGVRYPGICQTAPGKSPYFYEEDNWTDDMELGAALLHQLTHEPRYLNDALAYARQEPVTPWMGADTARHYQWYPWRNAGHYETWAPADARGRAELARYYRDGIERVVKRATNGFRVGIPFIWCSNDLMVAFATQAGLYRRMTGDSRFREYEQAAIDWLFGANPWGTSMVIGIPRGGVYPHDPHTELPASLHEGLTGGLVDGPVYASIFRNLRGISLHEPDEFAAFNTGAVVYHDDLGDYSTNEHIMDGTASLAYLLSTLDSSRAKPQAAPAPQRGRAAIDSLTDREFWRLFSTMSEEGGSFPSENFVSNEKTYQYVIPTLQRTLTPHGVYLGVGPEQNFTYIVNLEPRLAVIFDIRRQNAMLHLMYKALFELSPSRSAFVSRLFSRPLLRDLATTATPAEIFDAVTAATVSDSAFDANWKAIVERLKVTHGFAMSDDDVASMRRVFEAFREAGPEISYASRLGGPPPTVTQWHVTYAQLQTLTNADSTNMAFLATEERYRWMRSFEARNLLVPVVGDFAGPKAIRSVGDYLKQRGTTVTAFYTSNVEQYLFTSGVDERFYQNLASLPIDSTSQFIRSLPPNPPALMVPPLPSNLGNLRVNIADSSGVRIYTASGVDSSGKAVTTRVVMTPPRPTVANTSAFITGLAPISRALDAFANGRLKTYGQVTAMTKTDEWKAPR